MMSKEKTSFVYVTYILSTPEKVFEAITKPEIASRYWGHENVSDWKPGSNWQHVRAHDRTVQLVGEVVEVSPPKRLVITWANASQADDPESYSRVTFEIEPYEQDMVRLTVSHDELQAGSGMANGISKGWPVVLSSLKSYLETGRGLDVFAKPKAA
jgi:uncharacterized protein YndB with AHSA1/START domain